MPFTSSADTTKLESEVVAKPITESVIPVPSEAIPEPQGHANPGFTHTAAAPTNHDNDVAYANVNDLQILIKPSDRYRPDPTSTLRTADLMEYVKNKKRNGPNHELNVEFEVGIVFCLSMF